MRAGQEGALRLVGTGDDRGGADDAAGILEIFHAGAWGTVCDSNPGFVEPSYYVYADYSAGDETDPITPVCPSMRINCTITMLDGGNLPSP